MKYVGIRMNAKHSWNTFGCRIAEREIGQPEKKRIVETVPYSNAVQNFNTLYGIQTYVERDLRYQLVLMEDIDIVAQNTLCKIMAWLNISGYAPLYDDMMPGYYFLAEPLTPKITEKHGLYLIDVRFKASPFRYPIAPKLTYSPSTYPDLNNDGKVDSQDAAIILAAAAAMGTTGVSGLTPEQEILADIDRDGVISAKDAAVVSAFASAAGSGKYPDTPDGWTAFMDDRTLREEGIL